MLAAAPSPIDFTKITFQSSLKANLIHLVNEKAQFILDLIKMHPDCCKLVQDVIDLHGSICIEFADLTEMLSLGDWSSYQKKICISTSTINDPALLLDTIIFEMNNAANPLLHLHHKQRAIAQDFSSFKALYPTAQHYVETIERAEHLTHNRTAEILHKARQYGWPDLNFSRKVENWDEYNLHASSVAMAAYSGKTHSAIYLKDYYEAILKYAEIRLVHIDLKNSKHQVLIMQKGWNRSACQADEDILLLEPIQTSEKKVIDQAIQAAKAGLIQIQEAAAQALQKPALQEEARDLEKTVSAVNAQTQINKMDKVVELWQQIQCITVKGLGIPGLNEAECLAINTRFDRIEVIKHLDLKNQPLSKLKEIEDELKQIYRTFLAIEHETQARNEKRSQSCCKKAITWLAAMVKTPEEPIHRAKRIRMFNLP
jgi:hypothetical protein